MERPGKYCHSVLRKRGFFGRLLPYFCIPDTRENKENYMKLMERTADQSHQQSTSVLLQQAGKPAPESAHGDAEQLLALGERAISETISADPPATLKALRQRNCE